MVLKRMLVPSEAFTQYAFEHGITERKMAIDEIFVPEVRDRVKV
jgi:4,5-dihydroxyphthalate decarboxylase